MLDLKTKYGSTSLITGASSGIGEAFARELAARGMNLVLTARREEVLDQLAAELTRKHGVAVHVFALDLAAPAAAAVIERRLAEAGLTVDLLINNAGFGKYEEFGAGEMADDLRMVDLHCRAVVDLTWRLLPPMKARRRGAVIIVSSVLGLMPAPYLATYAATKAFDLSLGESLYGEMKRYGIDVLSIMPTLTATGFDSGAFLQRRSPLLRQPEDVVRTSLAALGRKPSVIDGWLSKLLMLATRFSPRRAVINSYLKYRPHPDELRPRK